MKNTPPRNTPPRTASTETTHQRADEYGSIIQPRWCCCVSIIRPTGPSSSLSFQPVPCTSRLSQLLPLGGNDVLMFWVGGQARLPVASSLCRKTHTAHRNFFVVKTCPEKAKPKGGTKGRPWPRHTSHTRRRPKPPHPVVPPATALPTQRHAPPWCVPRCFSSCCAKVISRNISCSTWLDCWALIARVP